MEGNDEREYLLHFVKKMIKENDYENDVLAIHKIIIS